MICYTHLVLCSFNRFNSVVVKTVGASRCRCKSGTCYYRLSSDMRRNISLFVILVRQPLTRTDHPKVVADA